MTFSPIDMVIAWIFGFWAAHVDWKRLRDPFDLHKP